VWPELAAESEARAPYAGGLWTYSGQQPCASWPLRDPNRHLGPWDAEPATPPMVIGTLLDPATPYDSAVEVSKLVPGARLLTLDGVGHGNVGSSQCVDWAVTSCLLDGTLPAEGTVCPSDVEPFGPAPEDPGV
jgi:hypothetical protein